MLIKYQDRFTGTGLLYVFSTRYRFINTHTHTINAVMKAGGATAICLIHPANQPAGVYSPESEGVLHGNNPDRQVHVAERLKVDLVEL